MSDSLLDLGAERIELETIAAEAIGWLPMGEGAYLHIGILDEEVPVITVVGMPDAGMVGMNVLLMG